MDQERDDTSEGQEDGRKESFPRVVVVGVIRNIIIRQIEYKIQN